MSVLLSIWIPPHQRIFVPGTPSVATATNMRYTLYISTIMICVFHQNYYWNVAMTEICYSWDAICGVCNEFAVYYISTIMISVCHQNYYWNVAMTEWLTDSPAKEGVTHDEQNGNVVQLIWRALCESNTIYLATLGSANLCPGQAFKQLSTLPAGCLWAIWDKLGLHPCQPNL